MRFRPVVSALLLAAYLPSCTSFQATTQPIAELTSGTNPVDRVIVMTTTGAVLDVWGQWVSSDTLHGFNDKPGPGVGSVAIPVPMIRSTQVRKEDLVPTVLLAGLVGLWAAAAISYASDPM